MQRIFTRGTSLSHTHTHTHIHTYTHTRAHLLVLSLLCRFAFCLCRASSSGCSPFQYGPTCTSRNSIMLAKKQEKNSNVHRFMQADSRYNPNGPTCTSHNSIMLAKKQGEKQQRSPFYASRKQVQSQRAHLHITQQHYACHNVTKPNSTFFKAFCSFLCKQVHLESRFIHNGHGPTCTADSSNIIMCGTTTLDS